MFQQDATALRPLATIFAYKYSCEYDAFETQRPALALVTGRRRVGKTFLLTHAWEADNIFLFAAARTTPELNRQQLIHDLAAWCEATFDPADFPSWRTVFHLLVNVATSRATADRPKPSVVVLDEFQYLADGAAGMADIAAELNAVWGGRALKRAAGGTLPLLLVLAGSEVTSMQALASGGSPLYGRFDGQHTVEPFTYWFASKLAAFDSLRERALTYGVFGGTPRYLAAIDTGRSLAENTTNLLLSPRGEVRLLLETALDHEHLEMLRRSAAGGFTAAFRKAVEASERRAILWSLNDLYATVQTAPA